MMNVTSPTTELTFTAPSLPDGVFVSNITVTVTAINRFGYGPPSDPEKFEISKYIFMIIIYILIHICQFKTFSLNCDYVCAHTYKRTYT